MRRILLSFPALLLFFSCSINKGQRTPTEVIRSYERFVYEMKPDSISGLFTKDAVVGHNGQVTMQGRDSIYHFLLSFKNIKVIRNMDEIKSVFTKKDSSIVQGNYYQTVIISNRDTIRVSGTFSAILKKDKKKNWFISSMMTRSQ